MAKIIKVSTNKAYRVEGIEINGKRYVSIRQLYKTKKQPDPKKWQVGRAGVTLDLDEEVAERVARAVKKLATDEDTDFKKIDMSKKDAE